MMSSWLAPITAYSQPESVPPASVTADRLDATESTATHFASTAHDASVQRPVARVQAPDGAPDKTGLTSGMALNTDRLIEEFMMRRDAESYASRVRLRPEAAEAVQSRRHGSARSGRPHTGSLQPPYPGQGQPRPAAGLLDRVRDILDADCRTPRPSR